jgi:hypothetical protein
MSDEQFRNEAENSPADSVPPPKTARSKKSNGRGSEDHSKSTPDHDDPPIETKSGSGPNGETTPEDLSEDEAEFARLRRDLPNVEGSAAIGIVSIAVAKAPPKNEFFRVKKGFRPIVDIVVDQVGLDQRYYVVDRGMAEELRSIGISFAPHALYLILTTKGAFRIIPARCPDADGARNDYAASKELALREAEDNWLRLYTDKENQCYRRYPAPKDRFPEPVWPQLTDAKIFRLAFRERGCLIDSPQHSRFIDWTAAETKNDGK